MTDMKDLKEEELEKVAGGAATEGIVQALDNFSVGQTHQFDFVDDHGSGYEWAKIAEIDKGRQQPFYVHHITTYDNVLGGNDAWTYWTLSQVQAFWNK